VASWRAYYTRRYIRILIPMSVAIAIAIPLNERFSLFNDSVLWSLLCEEVYYLIYPTLLRLRDWIGWKRLFFASWVAALTVAATNLSAISYPAYGPWRNWILGLPCWLIGARMAERTEIFELRSVSTIEIWAWRMGIWATSCFLAALTFHTVLHFPLTLNIFAVLAGVWIEREIAYYRTRKSSSFFEALGAASYSLYLIHGHCGQFVIRFPEFYQSRPVLGWWTTAFITAVSAWLFYRYIEKPSHKLARKLGYAADLSSTSFEPAAVSSRSGAA
jgi:peptidoglycan/LPS O-acetylase OafA/YrhL